MLERNITEKLISWKNQKNKTLHYWCEADWKDDDNSRVCERTI